MDEGVGVHALAALAPRLDERPDIRLVDGGTLSFTLATEIEDADDLIVIDAARLDAAAGSVRVFIGDEMDRFLGGNRKASVHEVGLLDLLGVVGLSGRLPARRALVAVEPERVEWGEAPTTAVAGALPTVCERVEELLERWEERQ
jgi:hydrogenase maturation protease